MSKRWTMKNGYLSLSGLRQMGRYAAIDIGSNTILMTIAELGTNGKIAVLEDKHDIARLGERVDSTGLIQPEALERASNILKSYREICRSHNVESIRAAATSAMRDARNRDEAAAVLSDAIGLPIEIIPGKSEAALSYLGSVNYKDMTFPDTGYSSDKRTLVTDIGGGSTELITGRGLDFESSTSINVGCVRITEKFFGSHPPASHELKNAKGFITDEYRRSGFKAGTIDRCIAVAGTATTIAALNMKVLEFDYNQINGYVLTPEKLDEVMELLLSHSVPEIVKEYGVHPKRADVITSGTVILKALMDEIQLEEVSVSVQGLRYGLLFDLIKNNSK